MARSCFSPIFSGQTLAGPSPGPKARSSGRWAQEAWSGPGPILLAAFEHGSGGDPRHSRPAPQGRSLRKARRQSIRRATPSQGQWGPHVPCCGWPAGWDTTIQTWGLLFRPSQGQSRAPCTPELAEPTHKLSQKLQEGCPAGCPENHA